MHNRRGMRTEGGAATTCRGWHELLLTFTSPANDGTFPRGLRPCEEGHCATPRSRRLTHVYLCSYTSINSQRVIDPKCRTLTICYSEHSLTRRGARSSNDCAAKASRRWGP